MFHGDVKPDNFRLNMNEDGTDVKLVLIDPGSASINGTRKQILSYKAAASLL